MTRAPDAVPRVYHPHQHQSKPLGCQHETLYASVELWVDDPPDIIELGAETYARVATDRREGATSA